ncbi:MAG: D-tyrosyl-tRNA(Tyr) deacylase [Bacteroidia bacterium]|nr:D-tyrosyl-tRNA(Tyr) deacylase [Bacteroidia bacterium]
MRLLIQRVNYANVRIAEKLHASIQKGLLVFVGIESADTPDDIVYLSGKLVNLRIFEDEEGKMNRSVKDIQGELLIVSQFTLHASTRKGNRPSFITAAKPEQAESLYNSFVLATQNLMDTKIQTGVFGANMQIELLNSGPVTLLIDSKTKE